MDRSVQAPHKFLQMNTVSLDAQPRTDLGKKATRDLRKGGRVPAVLYGQNEPKHFTLHPQALRPLIYTADFVVAEFSDNGSTSRAIVKDIQFHPVTEEVLHVDFLELTDGVTVKVELPVTFTGTSPGVKGGGKLQQSMRRVKVKASPENLVDQLKLDISSLELGQSIRVRDIDVPEGIEIMSAGATPVATVIIPRALRSAATAEAKAARAAGNE